MGYTRYWTITGELDENKFADVAKRLKNVMVLTGAWDTLESIEGQPPRCGLDGIVFNGRDDEGHETFSIHPTDTGWDFCKTARKPYDVFVHLVLRLLEEYFPDQVEIDSDGPTELDDECDNLFAKAMS